MNTHEFELTRVPLDDGRVCLIEANAGTGKTFNIQHLHLRLLLERGLEVGQILVVTFTEAATAELRDRIRRNLAAAARHLAGDDTDDPVLAAIVAQAVSGGATRAQLAQRVQLALSAFDEAAIFTIHGFCHRVLNEHAFDSGTPFDRELLTDAGDLLRDFVADFYRREVATLDPAHFTAVAATCSLDALVELAGQFLARPDALPLPEAAPDANAAARALLRLARELPRPARASGFREALLRLQALADDAPEARLQAALADPGFDSDTARNHAPAFVAALTAWQELPALRLRLALRAALFDPETGLAAHRERQRVMSYDDLLHDLRRALTRPAADGTRQPDPEAPLARLLRARFRAALIDEFQDTDPVQYEIFGTLFRHPQNLLFVIGDPKQAIYTFRGGDIHAYLDAAAQIPEAQRYTLARNYRAEPNLIAAVNQLFTRAAPFVEPRIDYTPSQAPQAPPRVRARLLRDGCPETQPLELVWVRADDPEGMSKGSRVTRFARETAARIVALLRDPALTLAPPARPPAPGDIAVLVRTNAEAGSLRVELARRGVPAVIYQAGSVFAAEEAVTLAHALAALDAPGDATRVRTLLQSPWCGEIALNAADAAADAAADDRLAEEMAALRLLLREWQQRGILTAFARLQQRHGMHRRIAGRPHAARALSNLRQLLELLHQAERTERLAPEALLRWLRTRIDRADQERQVEVYEQRLESDSQAVTVMTIHKSKGLEFPVVFCPFLWSRGVEARNRAPRFGHDPGRGGRLVLTLTAGAAEAMKEAVERETLAEDVRLAYVALTRASQKGIFFYGNFKGAAAKTAIHYLLRPALGGDAATPDERADPAGAFLRQPPTVGQQAPVFGAGSFVAVSEVDEAHLGVNRDVYVPVAAGETLVPPPPTPRVPDDWAIMSYSSLGEHDHAAPTDDRGEAPPAESAPPEVEPAANPYDLLPGGNQTGLCLHAIFELLDFRLAADAAWPSPAAAALIRAQALRFGLIRGDGDRDRARLALLAQGVGDTLRRELPDVAPGFRLAALAPADCRREFAFDFAVPRPIPLAPLRALGLRLRGGAGSSSGFMTGSIDLVFRAGGRYYFADWKSDRLPGDAAYAPEALRREMTARSYTLQAMIYAVALRRLLHLRLGAAFRFDAHFGGGFYFFLRAPDAAQGLYAVQPAAAQLDAWDSWLAGPAL